MEKSTVPAKAAPFVFNAETSIPSTKSFGSSSAVPKSEAGKPLFSFSSNDNPKISEQPKPSTVASVEPKAAPLPLFPAPANSIFGSSNVAFNFGSGTTSNPATTAPPSSGFNFSGANSFASGFAAGSSGSGFGSGGGIFSSSASFPSSTFGFPSSAPTSTFSMAASGGSGNTQEDDGGDDEGEPILEPEKAIRDVNDTDEILHEVPCQLFRYDKALNEWKGTGKGTFRITRNPDTKKQRMLVRNIIGKITFNASFYKEMTLLVEEGKKPGIKFSAVVAVEETVKDDSGKSSAVTKNEMKSFMLRLKPTDLAQTASMMRAGVASRA